MTLHKKGFFLFLFFITACDDKPPTFQVNTAPQIFELNAQPKIIYKRESSHIKCKAIDLNGDSLFYHWESYAGTIHGNGSTIEWRAPAFPAQFSATCTVKDHHGGTDSRSLILYVLNYDPVPFKELDVEVHSALRVTERFNLIFRTRDEWASFWEKHRSLPTLSPPEMDFEQRIVIGVFWGLTSGCNVRNKIDLIKFVGMGRDTLYVETDLDIFREGCDAEITPMHLISIEKIDVPVEFVDFVSSNI